MKTILFNGCSFVAGDEFYWEKYCNENNLYSEWCNPKTDEEAKQQWIYRYEYRKKYNLPASVAKRLNLKWVDLSEDGNSNDAITMSTINFLLRKPKEERKNFHVIIGWSGAYRRMVWCKNTKSFLSLHNNHIDPFHQNKEMLHLIPYVKEAIIMADIQDHFYNYVKNILLLENFLLANSCSYTFYRSLGSIVEFDNCKVHPINYSISEMRNEIKIENYTNHNNWYKFIETDNLPFIQSSVATAYIDGHKENWIDSKNSHPNYNIIQDLADKLSMFLKSQLN